ncbi:MAG: right-handed parallel beta-helix repeat-containing protein [Candidatus Cloacimonetes bacterium]|nr:right-handed parallel beta-helix repeat-containing protein [Candidatus Cloacimonadota bacterium]MCF7814433.1 right-handed parallel beta-helix repeat-containing protein [Candidatus Cloacimonadota bacterium]MCF7869005.1 right-handed parallel beta-helix repeat-containing protein [Candidatus Cloacimonadota bacterium]MCF7884417.1 right-handed parallel beta-helix repeat-containing protein [Candidatus Cloacimonadota bacterium]
MWLHSTTWYIKLDGTGDFTTIQQGINVSTHSDTVLVYPGTYYENIDYNGKNITVASLELTTSDPQYISQTVIDGQRQGSCVSVVSGETNTILQGLTIKNGQGNQALTSWGGGITIYVEDTQVNNSIINCVITENYAIAGAGLSIFNTNLFLSGTVIRNNFADRAGGAIGVSGDSNVTFDEDNRCNIYNNLAAYMSEIYISSIHVTDFTVIVDTFTVYVPSEYFVSNVRAIAVTYNFDILNSYLEPIDHDLYVSPNGSDENSGLSPDQPMLIINRAVRKVASNPDNPNTVYLLPGFYNDTSNPLQLPFGCKPYVNIIGNNLNDTIIDGESNLNTLFMGLSGYEHSLVKNLSFLNGFCNGKLVWLHNTDFIVFENILIQDCIITGFGAAISSSTAGGNIELRNVTAYNTESQIGSNSGAWFNGTTYFEATDCTFSNNSISGGPCHSAGLYVMSSGDVNIENCKFINNSGPCPTYFGYASALLVNDYNGEIGDININNNLFLDNHIENGRGTIYIDSEPNSSIHFSNNTVVNNISSYGVSFNGNMYLQNNVLRNPGDYEVGLLYDPYLNFPSTLYSLYNNIEGGSSAIFSDNNSNVINLLEGNIDEDPQFLLSGDDPYQLSELSPCIDNGTPDTTGLFLPPWDLLHHGRIWDGDGNGLATIDMGCYEFGAPPVVSVEDPVVIPNDEINLCNYPNPFNPSTTISFNVTQTSSFVTLEIFNIKGQKVKTLLNSLLSAGHFECVWNGKNDAGKSVSSGEYFARLKVNGEEIDVRKMLLMK